MGFAITDLLDYWLTAPNSVALDNPERTFWYAVRRASWMGVQFLSQQLAEAATSDSLDALHDNGTDFSSDAAPEDDVIEREERELVLALAGDLDSKRSAWLTTFLAGLSTREASAEEGIPLETVKRHRRQGIAALKALAVKRGLAE